MRKLRPKFLQPRTVGRHTQWLKCGFTWFQSPVLFESVHHQLPLEISYFGCKNPLGLETEDRAWIPAWPLIPEVVCPWAWLLNLRPSVSSTVKHRREKVESSLNDLSTFLQLQHPSLTGLYPPSAPCPIQTILDLTGTAIKLLSSD